jgi:hypothetical protein
MARSPTYFWGERISALEKISSFAETDFFNNIGTKQTLASALQMSAFGGEADMMQTSSVKIFRFDSPGKCL